MGRAVWTVITAGMLLGSWGTYLGRFRYLGRAPVAGPSGYDCPHENPIPPPLEGW